MVADLIAREEPLFGPGYWPPERDLCVLIAGLDFGLGSEWSEAVGAREWRDSLLRLPRATAISTGRI